VEGAANRRFRGGWCDWCHDFVDPAVSGGAERIDGGRLWCGLCPRFPATEALHDAAWFARRAQRLLAELEPERLDEFEADLDLLNDAVADLSLDPPMTELLAGWSACGAGLERVVGERRQGRAGAAAGLRRSGRQGPLIGCAPGRLALARSGLGRAVRR
jgi:hypothetical protein